MFSFGRENLLWQSHHIVKLFPVFPGLLLPQMEDKQGSLRSGPGQREVEERTRAVGQTDLCSNPSLTTLGVSGGVSSSSLVQESS